VITGGVLLVAGIVVLAGSAVLVSGPATRWDAQVFRRLSDVPGTLAAVLAPASKLFGPWAIALVVVVGGTYAALRSRSLVPVAVGAAAGGVAWATVNVTKVIFDRPRPFEVIPEAILHQHIPLGRSFPSSHTAVALAVAIALVPFLPRWGAAVAIAYAALVGWSRIYVGVHFPLDVLGGAGIGMAVGGATLMVLRSLVADSEDAPDHTPEGSG